MRRKNFVIQLLIMVMVALPIASMAQKDGAKGVYAFGYATCLGDSVAYITGIQRLDSAVVNKKTATLEHREYYSRQLEQALAGQFVGKHYTCALFFAKEKEKVEKQYVNLMKTLSKDKGIVVDEKTVAAFRFRPVVER